MKKVCYCYFEIYVKISLFLIIQQIIFISTNCPCYEIILTFFSELHIAAKLGRELLLQNDAIREKNRMLWEVNEENAKEIEMLRQQNKLLREEAESKANDQVRSTKSQVH